MLDRRVIEHAVLRIGGTAFDARASALPLGGGLDPAYAGFMAAAPEDGDDVVAVDLVRGDADPPKGARQLSSGAASWSAYSLEDGDQAIALAPAGGPVWWARFDRAVTRVRVTCGPLLWNEGVFYGPLRYPLDQLLMMYRLAGEGGAVIHCAVVAVGDRAVLCPGVSGAGKTTLTRQLTGCAGLRVLSDDRAIVRRGPAGYRAYGTPWPGEGGQAVNEGLPLAAIAFLEQGKQAATRPIALPEAMKRIARVSSVPWYDRAAGPSVFDGLTALCRAIPTSVLTFAPDPSVAAVLMSLSGAAATLSPS